MASRTNWSTGAAWLTPPWALSNREAVLPSSPDQRQAVEALAVDSNAFVAGRVLGGAAAVVQGVVEVDAGASTIGGGAVACGTGVLCPAGAAAVAGGAVVTAHGASVAIQGAAAAGQQANILFAKGGGDTTAQANAAGDPYPTIIDPRTGKPIAAPPGGLSIVDKANRVSWTMDDRAAFIRQWHENGFAEPSGGWAEYDIHHVIPREYGGTNDFYNLVPVLRDEHQQLLNTWWNNYQ